MWYLRTYRNILGWPKSSFRIEVKIKGLIFHFHQELYRTMYSSFCSTTFCHFKGNFITPSSPNTLSLSANKCSRCPFYSLPGNWNFLPLTEFCKYQNKWKSQDEYHRWLRTSQPSFNSLCLSSKKHTILQYPDGRLCIFCWLILTLFVKCCLQLV